jgi:hypothetical protein
MSPCTICGNRHHQGQLTLDAVQDVVGFVQHEVEADLTGHGVRSAALLHPLEDLRAHSTSKPAQHLQMAALWWHPLAASVSRAAPPDAADMTIVI